jgi:hypothetical protein
MFLEDLYAKESKEESALSLLQQHMEAQGMKWEEPGGQSQA